MVNRNNKGRFVPTETIVEITKDGKVIQNGIERKLHARKADGYVITSINNKSKYVHRLVAEKYLSNPHNLPVINHKDGNTSNNHVDNLEWTTRRKNCEHARLNGLSETKLQGITDLTYEQYIEMKKLYKEGTSKTKLGELFNRDRRTIYDILEGKRYKDYLRKEEETYL
jgi:ABC-type proline/glycine betaine transport system ATPase subunit